MTLIFLTVGTYIEIGKLEGAPEQRANAIFENLNNDEKEVCKRIFPRLTQLGEGTEDTKRCAYRQEFGASDTVDAVLQKIGEARLITMEGETEQPEESFVEVSHEALIRGWYRLRKWIDASRSHRGPRPWAPARARADRGWPRR